MPGKKALYTAALLLLLAGCATETEKPEKASETKETAETSETKETSAPIKISKPENINAVQLGTIRIEAEEYDDLDSLIKDLEQVSPVKEQKEKGEDYFPLSLLYEDGSKEIFYFFQDQENWYVETDSHEIYEKADFIQNYVDIDFSADVQTALNITPQDLKEILELQKKLEAPDTRFFLASGVSNYIKSTQDSQEEAVSAVKERLLQDRRLSEYATRAGYEVTEEQLQSFLDDAKENLLSKENYKEYETVFEDYGTDPETCLNWYRESIKEKLLINKLYLKIRKDFADGSDEVNGTVYETAQEYSKAFLEQVVYPETEEYDLSSYEEELSQAEAFYNTLHEE